MCLALIARLMEMPMLTLLYHVDCKHSHSSSQYSHWIGGVDTITPIFSEEKLKLEDDLPKII